MIIADTSGLLAFFNESEPTHTAAREAVDASAGPVVVSPFVLAELDYLVATRMGLAAELAILEELAGGAYDLVPFGRGDLEMAVDVVRRYPDQEIGLADASLVVLAERFSTKTLLTLDHRHFDVLRPIRGGRFRLLP